MTRGWTCFSALLGLVALAACGPGDPEPIDGTASAQAAGRVTIWSDIPGMQEACDAWADANAASCAVYMKAFDELKGDFERDAPQGQGPDILAYPHDALGGFLEDGLVSPIDLGARAGEFVDVSIDALRADGATYGVPIAVENVALLTNRALAPRCPETMEQLTEQAMTLVSAGTSVEGYALGMQVGETGDGYHWHPLYSAGGGYLFGRTPDGEFDVDDVGVGQPGSIASGEKLQELADAGVVSASHTRAILEEAFTVGKLAWWITGPWSVPAATDAGIDVMVCPIPTWADGAPSQPLVGVQALFLSSYAREPALATDFLTRYATSEVFQETLWGSEARPPALKSLLREAVVSDPTIAAFATYAQQGIPMPSIPEMDGVWPELSGAQLDLLRGGDPQDVMTTRGQNIAATMESGPG